ncbi:MAG: TfoX/Sxy family DNA transformation protein [Beijerinckiaceae bacterium]
MKDKISGMRNLGSVMERRLKEVGVCNAEDLRQIGAVEAYTRLRLMSPEPVSLIALYAMHAAILDCDWRWLEPDLKAELRRLVF